MTANISWKDMALQVIVQTLLGGGLGTIYDALMPQIKKGETYDDVEVGGEVLFQMFLTVASLPLVGGVVRGLAGSAVTDPTGGMPFMISIMESQPTMKRKIKMVWQSLGNYVKEMKDKNTTNFPEDFISTDPDNSSPS